MPTLLLIRHGQASFGTADYDRLSEAGHRQSELLGAWLADIGQPVDAIVTGGQRRHAETAATLRQGWQDTPDAPALPLPEVDLGLNEYDYQAVIAAAHPELNTPEALRDFCQAAGDSKRAFQTLFATAVQRWTNHPADDRYPESWPSFQQRVLTALTRCAEPLPDPGTALVVTSGGPIGAALQAALQLGNDTTLNLTWTLANTGITRLSWRDGRLRLISCNGIPHLERSRNDSLRTYR